MIKVNISDSENCNIGYTFNSYDFVEEIKILQQNGVKILLHRETTIYYIVYIHTYSCMHYFYCFMCWLIMTCLLFLESGLVGFRGMRGPPLILRRYRRTDSRRPARQLCSDRVRRDQGFTSYMSRAAIAKALPTWRTKVYWNFWQCRL